MFLVCLLMTCFISCRTTQTKVEYKVPEIVFPDFPVLGEYEIIENEKVVTDSNFFRQLLTFKIMYEEAVADYEYEKNRVEGETK